jgi:hypothetical protein
MSDIEPHTNEKEAGLAISFGGTIARSSLDRVVGRVIIKPRGIAFAIDRINEVRIPVALEPNESLKRCMKPIQKEVSHANHQEGFPRDGKEQKAACVN